MRVQSWKPMNNDSDDPESMGILNRPSHVRPSRGAVLLVWGEKRLFPRKMFPPRLRQLPLAEELEEPDIYHDPGACCIIPGSSIGLLKLNVSRPWIMDRLHSHRTANLLVVVPGNSLAIGQSHI
jgi:hypothetical protein